jgi:hypothetical protein
MANLQSTCIIGTLTLGTTCTTAAPGYMWFDSISDRLQYSYCNGAGISVCAPEGVTCEA